MSACCSPAVAPPGAGRNHHAVLVSNAEDRTVCTPVLGDDAEKLPCNIQEVNCTCLLWSGRQTHVAQQAPIAMFLKSTSFICNCYLSLGHAANTASVSQFEVVVMKS